MSDLPRGWTLTPVTLLCEKLRGVSYQKAEASNHEKDSFLPIIRANNIDDDYLNFNDLVYVPRKHISQKQMVKRNDVIVAMSSGSKKVVGKTAQAQHDWNGAFGAFCCVLRPTEIIEGKYFGYFFRTSQYRNAISELAAGTNINNIKNEHFDSIKIPLPPLNEQHNIVAKLEKLLNKVDACKERLEKIPTILKRFRQSVLSAACSGRLTADWREKNPDVELAEELLRQIRKERAKKYREECENAKNEGRRKPNLPIDFNAPDINEDLPQGWASCVLGNLLSVLSGEAFKKSEYSSSGARLLQIANVSFGKIIWEQQNFLPMDYIQTHSNLVLSENDIVIALNRPILSWKIKVGRISRNDLPAILYQRVGKLVFEKSTHEISDYIFLFLQSLSFIMQLDERLSGTDQPYINLPEMLQILLMLPPLPEQQEIVRRVEALFKVADRIEERYKKARGYVDKLTQAILAKAFRGELVPQDPNDEPASVLLERIREEREKNRDKSGDGKTRNHKRKQVRKRQLELDI